MAASLFLSIDCLMLRVPELGPALEFYCERLDHELLWRLPGVAGLRLPGTTAELVLHTEQGPEVDLLVDKVEDAVARFVEAGGTVIEPPFDIQIGRAAVVQDPFGNVLTLLDQSKGALATDEDRRVVGVTRSGAAPG